MSRRRKKPTPEQEKAQVDAVMKRTGWCRNCAADGCAQGFCCGHPSRQPRPASVVSYPDNSFYN